MNHLDKIPLLDLLGNYQNPNKRPFKTKISCISEHLIPLEFDHQGIEFDSEVMGNIQMLQDKIKNIMYIIQDNKILSTEYNNLLNALILKDVPSAATHIRVMFHLIINRYIFELLYDDHDLQKFNEKHGGWTNFVKCLRIKHSSVCGHNENYSALKQGKCNQGVPENDIEFYKRGFLETYYKENSEYLEDKIIMLYKDLSSIIHKGTEDKVDSDESNNNKKEATISSIINQYLIMDFIPIVEYIIKGNNIKGD